MTAPRLKPDAAEIRRALSLLVSPGDVFEIRSPDASNVRYDVRADSRTATAYGYFDSAETASNVVAVAFENAEADGVYLTLNRLHLGCLSRAKNRLVPAKGKKVHTASDKDVTRRSWLYIDVDPDRPSGICSTIAEKAAAFALAQTVDSYLAGQGFPRPLVLDSGSGAALLYRVDLPAEDDIIPALLKALDKKFTVPGSTKVDTTVGNPARICRLPGTVNGKGEDDPERPHRMARLHDVPDRLEIVPRELLEKVVGEAAPPKASKPHNGTDLASQLVSKAFPDAKPEQYQDGIRWKVTCPFNETHPDAAIFLTARGIPAFSCFHDSCADKKFNDALALLAPELVRKTRKQRQQDEDDTPRTLIVDNLADVQPEQVKWLWQDHLALGKVSLWQGNPGQGKSMLTVEMAACVSTGVALPGSNPFGPADVILASAEDALADTIRPRLDAAGGDPRRVHAIALVRQGERESFLTLADVQLIEELVVRTGAKLVVIDPLMAFLGKADAHKDQDVRSAIAPLAKMAERTGAAVVVVVHMNKGASTTALYRSGGSIGIVGAARTAFLVAPHPEDPDRKVIACVKSNIGPMPPALAYRIESVPAHSSARIRFERGTLEITADRLLAADAENQAGRGKAVAEAENFLRDTLKDGPKDAKDLKDEAEANGHSWRTIRRAQSKLKIVPQKATGEKGKWTWGLGDPRQGVQGGQGVQDNHVAKTGHLRPVPLFDLETDSDTSENEIDADGGQHRPPWTSGHLGHLGHVTETPEGDV